MKRFAAVALCLIGVSAGIAQAQTSRIEAVRVAAGTVLTFHLQTRLHAAQGDSLGALPEGSVLRVKMLDSIDSAINGDGSEFRGSIVSPLSSGNEVIIHSDSEVRGLLALLRSRSHPEGFRYELLVTGIIEGGKSYALTASLDPALFDSGTEASLSSKSVAKGNPLASGASAGKLP